MAGSLGDLCATCCYASTCAHLIVRDGHSSECHDYFSCLPPKLSRPSSLRDDVAPSRKPLMGLCCDCENGEDCCLAEGSEGGIWHCEEYR